MTTLGGHPAGIQQQDSIRRGSTVGTSFNTAALEPTVDTSGIETTNRLAISSMEATVDELYIANTNRSKPTPK